MMSRQVVVNDISVRQAEVRLALLADWHAASNHPKFTQSL
jgi:hypothetical protein